MREENSATRLATSPLLTVGCGPVTRRLRSAGSDARTSTMRKNEAVREAVRRWLRIVET